MTELDIPSQQMGDLPSNPLDAAQCSQRWVRHSTAVAGLTRAAAAGLLVPAVVSVVALFAVSCSNNDRDDKVRPAGEQTNPAEDQRANADKARLLADEEPKKVPENEPAQGIFDEAKTEGLANEQEAAPAKQEPSAAETRRPRPRNLRRDAVLATLDQLDSWGRHVKLLNLADGAVDSGEFSVARDLLNSCPPEHRGWEWDYLLGQTKEGVVSLTKFDTDWQRHGNNAVGPGGLRFSSDGKKMAVLNTAHLRVLDVANTAPTEDLNLEDPSLLAKVRHEWNGEARFGVAFSSDLRRLAATDNETVVVWDLATGKQVSRQSPEISPRLIHFLAFADEGSLSVVTTGFKNQGGKEKYMRPLVWDGVTGEAGSELEVHPVAIESHARYITSPTTVVDLASGSRVPIAIDVSRKLKACRFSSNGRWLFRHTVDGDKRDFFEVCDLNTGKINEVAAGIGPLDVSPQGDRLLTRSGIWDLARQQLILQLPGGTIGQWSPDGRRVAVAECAGWQIMYAPEHPELLPDKSDAPLTPYRKTIKLFRRTQPRYLAFSPDGTRIASASLDSTLRIWDAATGQPTLTFNGHTTPALNEHIAQSLHSFAFSPDGTRIASAGQTVKLWEAATGKEIRTFKRQNTQFTGVAFSPDGTRIAVGSTNGEVMLWDAATGTQLPTLKGHKGSISSVAFSPDGTRIASGSQDKTVTLWDATTGRATLTLREFADRVYRVTFSPDGRLIAASSHDGDVTLWDAVSGKRTLTIKGLDVAFSRDGRRLVSLSSGNSVKLWDAATGQELQTLTGHTAPVHCVAFSPDGTQIASGSMDETVIVWDLNTIPAAESTEQP